MATTLQGIQIQCFPKSADRQRNCLNAGFSGLIFVYKCFFICCRPVFNEILIHNL
jgi:hypothetical protein